MYRTEKVIVCQRDNQWGFELECGEFITQNSPEFYRYQTCPLCVEINPHKARPVVRRGLCHRHYLWLYRNHPESLPPPRPEHFASEQDVWQAIRSIRETWYREYGDGLPWEVIVA